MQRGSQRAAGPDTGRRARRWCAAGWALACLAGASAAPAEESLQGEEALSSGTSLEEVIVYARRREERLEDTPVAVTELSGQELHDESAVLLENIGRDVPNTRMVASPQSVSALDVTMRGQTVNRSAIMFDPAVGLYIDGVYVANGQGAMETLLDVDSVEVLRGSQGTLFGRNNTGGSILLFTHRPDLQQTSAELTLAGGNYGDFLDRAVVNVPLGSDFGIRLAFQGNDRSGFGSSIGNGQDNLENQHRFEARFGALWKPGDATEVYFTYERFEAREYGAILHPLTGPPPGTIIAQVGSALAQFAGIPGLPTVSFPANFYQTDGSFPASDNARTDSLQLTATQKLPGELAVKLILGYRHLDAATAIDVDASTLPLADSTLFNYSNQKSAELQLNEKLLDDRLDWVGGLYWFRDNGGAPSVRPPVSAQFLNGLEEVNQFSGGMANFLPLFGCPPPPAPAPFYCPSPTSPASTSPPIYEQNSVTNSSIAAYLHAEYQLTPRWAAAAGVRRTDDRRELEENDFMIIPGFGESCTISGTGPGPCPLIDRSVSYGFWSWELSSHYRLSPELNTYLRIGRSQRSGGWNAPVATPEDQPFKPEQLTDYELGAKADLLGGALLVNGDVFYGKYDSIQRLLGRLVNGTPTTQVINAGRARVSGAELEVLWRVTPRLSLQDSVGWTDARYQSFQYTPVAGAPALDLSGNEFYQTPRLQGDIAAIYQIPTAAGNLLLRADYAWQDRVEFNIINDFNYQGAYGTANARAALSSREQSWELALFADNLTDRRYAYTGGTILAPIPGAPGAPPALVPTVSWQIPGPRRVAGIEGTYRWKPSH